MVSSSGILFELETVSGDSVISSIPVGLQPYAITLNSDTGNIYVANSGSDNVVVIDGSTNTVVGEPIPVGDGPIALAYNSHNHYLYVANANEKTVGVIDTTSGSMV
ncbi:MAG: YncE family protein, partial [Nitrososphaera sp.]